MPLPFRAPHLRLVCLLLACALPAIADGPASARGEPHAAASTRSKGPEITLTGHPRATTRGRTTTIPFWAHGHPRSVTCRLDGGPARPCRSPARLHSLSYGAHDLRVQASNAYGSVTVTIRWEVIHEPKWKVVSTPVYVSPPQLDPPLGG